MKHLLKLICLIVIIAMVITTPAYAAEQSQRASDYFSAYKAYCYKVSSTDLRVYFSVNATGYMNILGANSITLQRSSNGTDWTTIKTFTKASYPQMVDTNAHFHSGYVSYRPTTGYYYRALVEFYAKNSTGSSYLYYYTERL